MLAYQIFILEKPPTLPIKNQLIWNIAAPFRRRCPWKSDALGMLPSSLSLLPDHGQEIVTPKVWKAQSKLLQIILQFTIKLLYVSWLILFHGKFSIWSPQSWHVLCVGSTHINIVWIMLWTFLRMLQMKSLKKLGGRGWEYVANGNWWMETLRVGTVKMVAREYTHTDNTMPPIMRVIVTSHKRHGVSH